MSGQDFRNALGRFATGVCLISVDDAQSGALALTANSFSSVSLAPPLVLWSIQNSSECFREYTSNPHFGVSVLASDHEAHSNRYARPNQHAIEASAFHRDSQGIPLLNHAAASFSCRLWAVHEAGDHHIIIGEVMEFTATERPPLLFHGGRYGTLANSEGAALG